MAVMLFVLQLLLAMTYAAPLNNGTQTNFQPSSNKQCFYNGRWFPVGAIISSGRSFDWCYGTYCDIDGTVKHWDNFNCDGSNQQGPSVQVRPHVVQTTPVPTTPAPAVIPTTTEDFFGSYGCWYKNKFYWSGEDIENTRRGFRCSGKYCDWNGQIQSWSDDCRYVLPPLSQSSHDFS